jgi:hypothetical protein
LGVVGEGRSGERRRSGWLGSGGWESGGEESGFFVFMVKVENKIVSSEAICVIRFFLYFFLGKCIDEVRWKLEEH